MAIYRNVHLSFWDDAKVVDDFTPEDRYFMLYILTNPHTNLCGCYEISMKKMETELGYTRDSIENLINRFKNFHKVIDYDYDTKEILVKNWHKYNWTASSKLDKPLRAEIENIKSIEFKRYLADLYNQRESVEDTVSIPYQYGSDTTDSVTVTDTVPDTVSDSVTATESDVELETQKENKKRSTKKTYDKKTSPVYYPDELLNKAFIDFIEMRKKIRKPMTDRAIELMKKKLKGLAASPLSESMDNDLAIKILEQSTMNCWQSLYPLKDDNSNKTQNVYDEWRNA